MGRIHLLDDDVINKIAAGEVVERPASVVKELVENALDAGARSIEVSLELGGVRSLAVTDDGSGMGSEDAAKALQRHATSKIQGADDLFRIATMGFRGEALASIAAVSRFTLATTEQGKTEGVKLTVAGGEPAVSWPWNGPGGTTIIVENLFFNMPVRAKFLKAPGTELSHCLELVQAFALCHPNVAFTLRHNGREQFRVPALTRESAEWIGETALSERARAVLGKDAPSLQYVRKSSRYGDLEALVSPPGVEKSSGKHLFQFVNGRWVKDRVIRYGLLRGYHTHLLKGRFPVVVAHVRMDPALVDVNVHPAKTEVRFQYPDEVQSLLALAVREKLRDATWAAPGGASGSVPDFGVPSPQKTPLPSLGVGTMAAERRLLPFGDTLTGATRAAGPSRLPASPTRTTRSFGGSAAGEAYAVGSVGAGRIYREASLDGADGEAPRASTGSQRIYAGPASDTTSPSSWDAVAGPVRDKGDVDALLARTQAAQEDSLSAEAHTAATETIPWDDLEYLGAFDKCYLLFAVDGKILVLDQHAFHERVLFERLVRDESLLTQSQQLLVPEAVELSPGEIAALRSRWPQLKARGFDYQAEGDTTVVVRAVPSLLAGRDLAGLFADLGRELETDGDLAGEPTDSNAELARLILAQTACHAAVRAGEELPDNELKQLMAEARTVDFYHNCPHGRRVFRWWTRSQVARWFDR